MSIRSEKVRKASETVQGFGEINPDELPLEEVAKNRGLASELVDRVRFEDGPQG